MADDPAATPAEADPLRDDARVVAYLGERYESVRQFADLLADQGVLRGLIGPRETPRLWERHILNSAAVAPFLPPGPIADVGSGAGLPGVVIAALEPARPITLIEPMERRCVWLEEVAGLLGLENVTVLRGRAEEVQGQVSVAAVTARAVAPVLKLVKWCGPLLAPGGEMHLLKGRAAAEEVEAARFALRKRGLAAAVHDAPTIAGLEPTRVVSLTPAARVGGASA